MLFYANIVIGILLVLIGNFSLAMVAFTVSFFYYMIHMKEIEDRTSYSALAALSTITGSKHFMETTNWDFSDYLAIFLMIVVLGVSLFEASKEENIV